MASQPAKAWHLLIPVAGIAIAVALAARLLRAIEAPLWFDETFSLVIASQPTFASLWNWVVNEIGGPLYYLFLAAWVRLAGDGDLIVRLPSLVFACVLPVVVLRSRVLGREMLWLWSALILLWPMGASYTPYARSYSLLLLFTTWQAITYIRLLRRPDLRATGHWLAISVICALTHYHSTVISMIQGLLFVALHKRDAVKNWPALALLAPALIWAWLQHSMVSGFVSPGANWYTQLSPLGALVSPVSVLGFGLISIAIVLEPTVRLVTRLLGERAELLRNADWPVALTVASGILAAALVVIVGAITPSFTLRYVTPYIPAIMLGLACWIAGLPGRYRLITPALVLGFLTLLVVSETADYAKGDHDRRKEFNTQAASDWIHANGGSRKLLFFWDSPTGDWSNRPLLVDFAGYYLRRHGDATQIVLPPKLALSADPNVELPALARANGADAIIWLYDIGVPGTRGINHPAQIARLDPNWKCQAYGTDRGVIYSCLKRKSGEQ